MTSEVANDMGGTLRQLAYIGGDRIDNGGGLGLLGKMLILSM
jgi:hypothetical protein